MVHPGPEIDPGTMLDHDLRRKLKDVKRTRGPCPYFLRFYGRKDKVSALLTNAGVAERLGSISQMTVAR
jgi:hypothetical protein